MSEACLGEKYGGMDAVCQLDRGSEEREDLWISHVFRVRGPLPGTTLEVRRVDVRKQWQHWIRIDLQQCHPNRAKFAREPRYATIPYLVCGAVTLWK